MKKIEVEILGCRRLIGVPAIEIIGEIVTQTTQRTGG